MAPSSPVPRRRPSRQAHALSDERLARKRALDREAQRHSRSKTKNHIALLESRIEALTRVRENGDTKELVEKIEEQRVENDALRKTLASIGKIIGGDLGGREKERERDRGEVERKPITPDSDDYEKVGVEGDGEGEGEGDLLDMGELPEGCELPGSCYAALNTQETNPQDTQSTTMDVVSEDALSLLLSSRSTQPLYTPFTLPSLPPSLSIPLPPLWTNHAPPTSCRCCKMVNFTTEILTTCSSLQLHNTANQRARDADIPIRAILHGWNAVTRRYSLDPIWASLRHADEVLLRACGEAERLVVLRNLCVMLRYRVSPSTHTLSLIPPYLHERPSQRTIPHEPLIDYLVWPGLRERIVFAPHRYCSEKFSADFWKCFRFVWGGKFEDAYVSDGKGAYAYSARFEKAMGDLGCFKMKEGFLRDWPELRADIGVAGEEDGERFEMAGLEDLEMLSAGLLGGEGCFV